LKWVQREKGSERSLLLQIRLRTLTKLLARSFRSLALIASVGLPGCGGPSGAARYEGMTAPEKARELTKLRREAEDQLALFDQSGGANLEALERYVELHHETTQIFPADCPICFLNYGVALSRLGLYYNTLVLKLEEEQDRAPADEKPELDEKIAKYREVMTRQFKLSGQQFEVYFRNETNPSAGAYYWVFRQYSALKDYQKALYYLDLYEANMTLGPEDKKNAAALRRRYEDMIRRAEEEELDRELRREEPGSGRKPSSPPRSEPAN
jgi:hypothetical protein